MSDQDRTRKTSNIVKRVDDLEDSLQESNAPVTSVNTKTGAVVLNAADVGALPDDTVIPPDYGPPPTLPEKIVNTVNGEDGDIVITPESIGALPDDTVIPEPNYPVTSVNSKTGAVVLNAADVGALPADTQIPVLPQFIVNTVNGKTGNVVLTSEDVGALPGDTTIPPDYGPPPVTSVNGQTGEVVLVIPPPAPVDSVNGKIGVVVLTAADVGALPGDTEIPPDYGPSPVTSVNDKTGDVELSVEDLKDVVLTTETAGEVLRFDGTNWVNSEEAVQELHSSDGSVSVTNDGDGKWDLIVLGGGGDGPGTDKTYALSGKDGVTVDLDPASNETLTKWIAKADKPWFDARYAPENIFVPTKTSQLENDGNGTGSPFATQEEVEEEVAAGIGSLNMNLPISSEDTTVTLDSPAANSFEIKLDSGSSTPGKSRFFIDDESTTILPKVGIPSGQPADDEALTNALRLYTDPSKNYVGFGISSGTLNIAACKAVGNIDVYAKSTKAARFTQAGIFLYSDEIERFRVRGDGTIGIGDSSTVGARSQGIRAVYNDLIIQNWISIYDSTEIPDNTDSDSPVTNAYGHWVQPRSSDVTQSCTYYAFFAPAPVQVAGGLLKEYVGSAVANCTIAKSATSFQSSQNTAEGGTYYSFYASGTAPSRFNGGVQTDKITTKDDALDDVDILLNGKTASFQSDSKNKAVIGTYSYKRNNGDTDATASISSRNGAMQAYVNTISDQDVVALDIYEGINSVGAGMSIQWNNAGGAFNCPSSEILSKRVAGGANFSLTFSAMVGNSLQEHLTLSNGQLTAYSGYEPQTDDSLVTKGWVTTNGGGSGGGDFLPLAGGTMDAAADVIIPSGASVNANLQVGGVVGDTIRDGFNIAARGTTGQLNAQVVAWAKPGGSAYLKLCTTEDISSYWNILGSPADANGTTYLRFASEDQNWVTYSNTTDASDRKITHASYTQFDNYIGTRFVYTNAKAENDCVIGLINNQVDIMRASLDVSPMLGTSTLNQQGLGSDGIVVESADVFTAPEGWDDETQGDPAQQPDQPRSGIAFKGPYAIDNDTQNYYGSIEGVRGGRTDGYKSGAIRIVVNSTGSSVPSMNQAAYFGWDQTTIKSGNDNVVCNTKWTSQTIINQCTALVTKPATEDATGYLDFDYYDNSRASAIGWYPKDYEGGTVAGAGAGSTFFWANGGNVLSLAGDGIRINSQASGALTQYQWEFTTEGHLVSQGGQLQVNTITSKDAATGDASIELGTELLTTNHTPTQPNSIATKAYVDANAGGGTGSATLDGLTDTDINSPVSDQFLVFRDGKWTNVSSTSSVPIIPPGENAGVEWDAFQWPTTFASNMFKVGLDGIFTDGVYHSTNGILWQQATSTVNGLLQADSSQIHKSTSQSNWYINDAGTAYSNDMRNWFSIESLGSTTSNGSPYGNVFCFNGEFYLIARERVTNNQGVPLTWKFLQYSRFYNQWLDPEDSTISGNIYAWLATQDAQASVSYAPWWTDSQGVSGNYVLGLLVDGTVISLDPVTAEVSTVANLTDVRSIRYGGEKFVAQFDNGTKSIATSENPITSDWGTLAMYPKAGPYEVPEYDGIGRWHIIPSEQNRLLYLYADDRENMVWIQNTNIGPKATDGNNYLTGANGRVILGSVYDGDLTSPDYTISQTYYLSGIDIGAGNYEADSKVMSLEKRILKLEALIREKCS